MKLKQDREAARKAAGESAEAELRRQHVIFVASNEERHVQERIAAGDTNAMVDLLDCVVDLHKVGAHEEAEALAGRIKATLAREDADEAEAFVTAAVGTNDAQPVEVAPTPKKSKRKP